jgi:hypothetical protein
LKENFQRGDTEEDGEDGEDGGDGGDGEDGEEKSNIFFSKKSSLISVSPCLRFSALKSYSGLERKFSTRRRGGRGEDGGEKEEIYSFRKNSSLCLCVSVVNSLSGLQGAIDAH